MNRKILHKSEQFLLSHLEENTLTRDILINEFTDLMQQVEK